MISIAVVGYGYWGKNLVRNFYNTNDCVLHTIVDTDLSKLGVLQRAYPTAQITADYQDVLNNPAIEAIVLATPVFSHYKLAKAALMAGKHVMVEKPMTATVAEAEELIALGFVNK